MSERRAQRPEDRTRRDHKGHQQGERFVAKRHPALARQVMRGDSDWVVSSTPGARDCNCDPNEQHADTAPYWLDDFGLDSSPPVSDSPDGGSWGNLKTATKFGEGHSYNTSTWERIDTPWTNYGDMGSSLGGQVVSGAAQTTSRQNSPACAQGAWYKAYGEVYREMWFAYTVPTKPANVAGVRWQPFNALDSNHQVYNSHSNIVGHTYGYQLRVSTTAPTSRRDGVQSGGTVWGTSNGPLGWYFIPDELLPAAGETVWFGIAPNWDTIPGDPINGPCHLSDDIAAQNFDLLAMLAGGSDGSQYYNKQHVVWQSFDSGEPFGWGNDGEDQNAWFAGNLPWTSTQEGGTWEVVGGVLKFTGPGKVTLRMEGADTVVTEPDQEDDLDLDEMGEPWSEENGVRMGMRFRYDTWLEPSIAGERGVTMRWNDHSGWVSMRVGLGDPTYSEGVRLEADGVVDETTGGIDVNNWVCMWMDTRMVSSVRARAWNEADPDFPWSGQTWRKLEVARDGFFEDEDDNAFEIVVEAGDGQIIEMDGIRAVGPALDGQIVHEHAGSGDGVRVTYFASQPYLGGTMEFDVAGLAVRALDVTPEEGVFQSNDGLPVPAAARMDLTYRVKREYGYDDDDEDPTQDDSADDPDYVAP